MVNGMILFRIKKYKYTKNLDKDLILSKMEII